VRLIVVVKSGPHQGLRQEFPYDAGSVSPHFSRSAALKRAGEWIQSLKAAGDQVTVTESEASLLAQVFPDTAAWESIGEGIAAWCCGPRVWSI
jgi:hypothetical protein